MVSTKRKTDLCFHYLKFTGDMQDCRFPSKIKLNRNANNLFVQSALTESIERKQIFMDRWNHLEFTVYFVIQSVFISSVKQSEKKNQEKTKKKKLKKEEKKSKKGYFLLHFFSKQTRYIRDNIDRMNRVDSTHIPLLHRNKKSSQIS